MDSDEGSQAYDGSESGIGLVKTQACFFNENGDDAKSISDNSSDDDDNSIDLRKYKYF